MGEFRQSVDATGYRTSLGNPERLEGSALFPLEEGEVKHGKCRVIHSREVELAAMQNGDTLILNACRYKLNERIDSGSSGYGAVWAARDPDGRPVAIKLVNADRMTQVDPAFGPQWRAHLEREIDFLSQLRDDEAAHIVKLLDHGDVDGQPVLVLERLQANLDQWLKQTPQPLPPRLVLEWAQQILAGLTTVHAHNFVYRDLKFGNVLVGENGRCLKLADFGTLKPHRDEGTVSFAGTPTVMAPEQRLPSRYQDGQPVYDIDYRTDYYALGLILFALFTGQRTVAAQSEIERMLERVGHEGASREGQSLGGLSDEEQEKLKREVWARLVGDATFGPDQHGRTALAQSLYELILALLAPRKEDRPASAEPIRAVLDDALTALPEESAQSTSGGPPGSPHPLAEQPPDFPRPPPGEESGARVVGRTRRRWIYPLITIAGLAAAVLGLYTGLLRQEAPPPTDTSTSLVELATAPKAAEPVENMEPVQPPATEITAAAPPAPAAPEPVMPSQTPADAGVSPAPPPATDQPPPAVPATVPPAPEPTVAKPAPAPSPAPAVVADRPPPPVSPVAKPSVSPPPPVTKPAPAPSAAERPLSAGGEVVPAGTPVADAKARPVAEPSGAGSSTTTPPPTRRAPPPTPAVLRDPLKVGGFAPALVMAPAGTLVLPGADGQPGRTVAIQPFAMAAQPVTFADYEFFARQTHRSLPYDGGLRPEERVTHPVTAITWYEAQAYVEWLSQQTGQRYRLPSEAEWVYAGQSGVGERGGIVWEWVADCAGNEPAAMPLHQVPRGEEDGGDCGRRVLRGDTGHGGEPRPADRGSRDIGFRVARELKSADTRP